MTRKVQRVSLSLYPDQHERCTERAHGGHVSTQIQHDLELLWAVLDRGLVLAKIDFIRAEVQLLCDLLNTYPKEPVSTVHLLRGGLLHSVSDGIELEQLDKKWGIDGSALCQKIKRMDDATILAIADFVRQFWLVHKDQAKTEAMLDIFRKE